MARRIVDAGYPATLWARRPATLVPFAGTAAARAASPSDLAAACDLVCVCVVDDADVEGSSPARTASLPGCARAG
jgi:3-hydroxyisobutyrate dehydrogenase-like beta-hydroxyacid dehydrogenase